MIVDHADNERTIYVQLTTRDDERETVGLDEIYHVWHLS